MGVEMKYLLAASFMAAPGSLLYANLMKPETGVPAEAELAFADGDEQPANVLDAAALGACTGLKLALNEFVAYVELAAIQATMTSKTRAICSVALCGFANFSSIAILLGGLGGMAPNRRAEIARLGLKAVAAGTLSNLTSAAIVGLFVA
jgi:nucleoside permease NupC